MSMNGRRFTAALLIGGTLVLGIMIGTFISHGVRAARASAAPDAALLPPPSPAELSNSFAHIAETLEPAVVNINTESTIHVARRHPGAQDDPSFQDFFDRFFQFGPQDGQSSDLSQQSLGSGVILDKNGYVLTNYHVVMQEAEDKPVDRIRVQIHGDDDNIKGYEARIVGTDKWTDLAVIKIKVDKTLQPAQLGESDTMRVGDWVLAIGSPFGLDSTVTAGIISAKGREIEGGPEGQFKRFLQTDAAINPGNSGGPLVNMAGQVIGINTAIATRHGSYDGVGFAIPSDTVRKVYNSLISVGTVPRGAIGVSFNNLNNPVLLHSFGADHGVVVSSVEPGSPADHAGLMRGDVIVGADGKKITNGDDLVGYVSDSLGKKIQLEYIRDKKRATATVEVGDRNKVISDLRNAPDPENDQQPGQDTSGGALGILTRNLSPDQAREVSVPLHLSAPQGVLVTEATAGGFASEMGLQRGDVILSINQKPVATVDEFNRMAGQLKSGMDVVLLVARRSQRSFTTVYLADRLP
ncbi:MAG TPA: Do family serine endopeptidase [Terriglobia bacterium]|nr:Do family serine endopeptidase [Terriglobia bacterium]